MDDNISENGSNLDDKNASFAKSEELSSSPDSRPEVVYAGPVFHIGVNRLGHHFCHLRFLRIRGNYIEMFKKEPDRNSKPIRQGISGKFLKVEDAGRRKINDQELYILRISDPLDGTTKGEIGCKTASDLQKWKNAFLYAKEEAGAQFRKSKRNKSSEDTDEFKLSGHRPRVRRYARDLIMIGKGSYSLLWKEGKNSEDMGLEIYGRKQDDDTLENHEWRCVRLVNGIRLLEDTSANLTDKTVILKAVGVVEASPSLIFEMLMALDITQRKEWDVLTGSLERIHGEGNHEIVYGTFDPTHTKGWKSKREFVFSRTWRHDPDNTYTIFQESIKKDKVKKKTGLKQITWNPTFWEIKPFMSGKFQNSKSLVSQTMEIRANGWGWKPWKKRFYDQLENSIHYMMLCQVAGLRDYFAANPAPEVVDFEKYSGVLNCITEPLQSADSTLEQFFDAEEPEEEEEEAEETDEQSKLDKPNSQRFKTRVLALMGLTPHGRAEESELVSSAPAVDIKLTDFKGSLPMTEGEKNSSCWCDPGGREFMVRGKTYPRDYLKIPGGDPLLKLIAVDWLQCEKRIDSIATSKNNVVQSESGKKLPFILVINLQVPATPNYSLVFYFGAEKPVQEGSLLDKFANGDDAFRDSRFKLIPRIVEGYWFVKRAVGTKACLLGKAVTCNYIRQDNFLEIDVDIGSSSVARSIINLVLGHVTSLVVDMAILIEGKDESELPEYLLGTTRVIRVDPARAVPYNH